MPDLTTLLSNFLVQLYAGMWSFPSGAAFTGVMTTNVDGIAVTSSDGLVLQNATPSTVGVPVQQSPRLRLRGTAWDNAASETVDWFFEVLPATAATPTGSLKIGYSLNGGAVVYPFQISNQGTQTNTGSLFLGSANQLAWASRARMSSAADGVVNITTNAQTIGSQFKCDALPTVASGFGTSPAITAGSTPRAGSVNVGTGGVATSGVINFNGTAFPSAPFVVAMNQTTGAVVRAVATTTQLTITAPAAFVASDVIAWICVGSK